MATCAPLANFLADLHGGFDHLVIVRTEGHEPNAFRLFTGHGLTQKQVVFSLGHSAEQRPDDRGMIAGRHTQPRVAINDARGPACHRNVRHHGRRETGADGRPLDRGDHRLGAVDHVVDDIVRLLPGLELGVPVIGHFLDQIQLTAGRIHASVATQKHHRCFIVPFDVPPNMGQFPVPVLVQSIQFSGIRQDDFEDARRGAIELQCGITGIVHGHELLLSGFQFGV